MRTLLALGMALLATGCANAGAAPTTGDDSLIGGDTEHNAAIPSAIGISVAGHHACTAARVGPRHLLTAAHCVLDLGNLTPYYDAAHDVAVRRSSGEIVPLAVKEVHVNEAFLAACKKTLCSISAVAAKIDAPDVAVIELVDAPADLATAAVDRAPLAPGDVVTLTGFGCTTGVHVTDTNVATALRSAPSSIVAADVAVHAGSYVTAADEPVYGGNYALTAGKAGLCPGDSGGPLFKGGAVVGVNANYTLLPDEDDTVGIPVTNWHTRLDAASRHDVGGWLTSLGVP